MNSNDSIDSILFPSRESLVSCAKDKNSMSLIIVGFLLLIRQRLLRWLMISGDLFESSSNFERIFSRSSLKTRYHCLELIFILAISSTPFEFILDKSFCILSSWIPKSYRSYFSEWFFKVFKVFALEAFLSSLRIKEKSYY